MLKTLALSLTGVGAAAFLFAGGAVAQNMGPTHEFLAKAGASDKFEIAEAKLVTARTHNAKLRRFANKMIHDHTASTAKLKMAGETSMGHKLKPPELNDDQTKMLADLRAARGRDFDKTYIDQQVAAHEQALELMKSYSTTTDYPKIAHAAGEIAPTVQMHLDMVRGMQSHMR